MVELNFIKKLFSKNSAYHEKWLADQLCRSIKLDLMDYINEFVFYKNICASWSIEQDTVVSIITNTHFNIYIGDPANPFSDETLLYHCHLCDLLYVLLHYDTELAKMKSAIDKYFDTINLSE